MHMLLLAHTAGALAASEQEILREKLSRLNGVLQDELKELRDQDLDIYVRVMRSTPSCH